MPLCYTCQEEITFDKNILSKTGKQIPLWIDKRNAHGHDENGAPVRQPLPNQQQQQTTVRKSFPSASTTTATTETTQGGSTLDTKRIFQLVKELDMRLSLVEKKLDDILEKITYNTQVDTDKLIGQLETIEQVIAPLLKTQIKKASEIHQEQQQKSQKPKIDPIEVNHGERADKFQSRRNVTTIPILEEENSADTDEYERTKQFTKEDDETDNDDEDDDNKIETED